MSHGYYQGDGSYLAVALVHYGTVRPDGLLTACGKVGMVSMRTPPTCPDCARKLAEAAAKRTRQRIETARQSLESKDDAPPL